MEAEPERWEENAAAPPVSGGIELADVSFRYSAEGPWTLRHVSVAIAPGEKVALVGRTGSGKSTLALALLGLHLPTEGEVRYDGVSLRGRDLRALRRQVGVVLQEPFLFSGTIRDNIAFSRPEMSLSEVVEAARLAAVHAEIEALPMGYQTRLAEGGAGLSGGQRQRLALARALAGRPTVLLLDEATSHLDAATEAEVDRNLDRLGCTRIVIAHRLSTVRNADRILVLEGGQVAERGTHAELVARGGLYAALLGAQHENRTPIAG
jgi:ABC-type bacteriocin/lantibiotic exporter with double-glycine peptidase domain